jgi:hypothetical protein
MDKHNPLHVALGIVALLGALLYVLACRPTWSPDSSKVLFPYCNPETDETGIALYDRNVDSVESIFSRPLEGNDCADELPSAMWYGDGTRVLVLSEASRSKTKKNRKTKKMETVTTKWARLQLLPVAVKGKTRTFDIRDFLVGGSSMLIPLAEADGKLYLGRRDKGAFVQVDLKSGKKKFRDLGDDREPIFYSRDGRIAYARSGAESDDDLEFGALDPKNLTLHSHFVLKKEALVSYQVKGFLGFLAFEPHGSRLVLPAERDEDPKGLILMCDDNGLQRVITPDLPTKAYEFGSLEWSRDGKTLYSTVVTPTEDKKIQQYSLGEIPVGGGPVRLTPMVRAHVSSDDADLEFQVALSPDGSMIAATTAYFGKEEVEPADRGLFLVDLRDPQRKVTKIQYPPMQPAAEQTSKE